MKSFVENRKCLVFKENTWSDSLIPVPKEVSVSIEVNCKKLVSILCTPYKIECLIIGFLFSEGIIASIDDVKEYEFDSKTFSAKVIVKNSNFDVPSDRTLTSGFGKGTIFKTEGERIESNLIVSPEDILSLLNEMNKSTELYQISGGVHASAIADRKSVILIAEDIGRHNTFDKIQGECLKRKIDTKDKIVITTGRISSEMLLKASKMFIPVVVSMKSPTGNAVKLAESLNISLVGHAKKNGLVVYTCFNRIKAI